MSIYTFSEAELRSHFIKNIGNRVLKASLNTILRIKIIKHSLVISKSTEQLNHRQ